MLFVVTPSRACVWRLMRCALLCVLLAVAAWAICAVIDPAGPFATLPAHALGTTAAGGGGSTTIQTAASNATATIRNVAGSVVGLGLALAGIILVFKRDFSWAAAAIACGVVAYVLISSSGAGALKDFVTKTLGG